MVKIPALPSDTSADDADLIPFEDVSAGTTEHITKEDLLKTSVIKDTNKAEAVEFSETASAVNHLKLTNSATGNAVEIEATGDDANIDFNIATKGTGNFTVNGNPIGDGAWAAWTPTYSNITIGNGTVEATYTQIGKTIHGRFSLIVGSTTSLVTGMSMTAPATPATRQGTYEPIGNLTLLDSGVEILTGLVYLNTTNANIFLRFFSDAAVGAGVKLVNTMPITEAAGDELAFSFTYEAA